MFLFELALALGFPHPRHLLAELTSQEVTEWMAFYALRPFGYARESKLHGVLAAFFYNANRGEGQRSVAWQEIFPVEVEPERQADSDEKIIELFQEYNRTHAKAFEEQAKRRGPKKWKLRKKGT